MWNAAWSAEAPAEGGATVNTQVLPGAPPFIQKLPMLPAFAGGAEAPLPQCVAQLAHRQNGIGTAAEPQPPAARRRAGQVVGQGGSLRHQVTRPIPFVTGDSLQRWELEGVVARECLDGYPVPRGRPSRQRASPHHGDDMGWRGSADPPLLGAWPSRGS